MTGLFKILIVDDDEDYRETYKMLLSKKGYSIETSSSAEQAFEILEKEYYPLIISDIMMPGISGINFLKEVKQLYDKNIEVIMVTGYGSIETAVQAMKIGAFGYFIKSHNPEELILEIEKVRKIFSLQNANKINKNKEKIKHLYTSKNKTMQNVFGLVDRVANSNANILITGESGVGKEIIAQLIHEKSNRLNMPFIPINCQYYSHSLIESELFGHEKGSFTGATSKRIGRLEESNGGTIFLDEIGDMELSTQIKLLRVLETKKIERIGSNKIVDVDFRLVSATNKNLSNAVVDGTFREDLLYRTNTIEIRVPPLRQRREDLEDLIYFFINMFNREMSRGIKTIEDETKSYLLSYSYPGNIRELKNMIERMVVLSNDGVLRRKIDNEKSETDNINSKEEIITYKEARKEFEIKYILNALKVCNNNITHAANLMGMSRRQLFNKISEYKLK